MLLCRCRSNGNGLKMRACRSMLACCLRCRGLVSAQLWNGALTPCVEQLRLESSSVFRRFKDWSSRIGSLEPNVQQ